MFWWLQYIGVGIHNDIKNRLAYLKSDFTDAWNYRVIASTVFIFFINILAEMAFAQDMLDLTNKMYGVNEVLLSSAIAGTVYGLFSGQPLCLVGVTGPIAVFSNTIYDITERRGTNYFPFICWVYIWSFLMHIIVAVFNWVSFIEIITLYSCEVFGFYVNCVYLQKGVQLLSKQFAKNGRASGFCSVMIALLMVFFGVGSNVFGSYLHYFRGWIRKGFVDYGVPLSVIFLTGFIHFGGYLSGTELAKLPVTHTYEPTKTGEARAHGWFIHFWPPKISVGDIFLAIPFAILLFLLFYFDHNVSSLMCQLKEFPLKKPSSFHWDFTLLGITTLVSGLIGIPPPNGLIPQAPLHTASLVIQDHNTGKSISVVEQRVTNTLQGLMTFVMMSPPFLVILGLIPQGLLSGLFFVMGITGIHANPITNKLRFICMDPYYIRNNSTCPQYFKDLDNFPHMKWFYLYVILQLIAFGCEFGITMTKGAVGFPGVLMLFVFLRKWIYPLIIPKEDLDLLDSEVADKNVVGGLFIMNDLKKRHTIKKEGKFNIEELAETDQNTT